MWLELQLAVLENEFHFNGRKALVQELQAVPVLVLQGLVDLAVPVQPPRALRALWEVQLQAAEDAPHLLDGGSPAVFSPHEIRLYQRADLIGKNFVPLPQGPILLSELVRNCLQPRHIALQRRRDGEG